MKLLLVRKKFAKDRTLGELYVEGIGWYCNECEKGVELCESCLNEESEVE